MCILATTCWLVELHAISQSVTNILQWAIWFNMSNEILKTSGVVQWVKSSLKPKKTDASNLFKPVSWHGLKKTARYASSKPRKLMKLTSDLSDSLRVRDVLRHHLPQNPSNHDKYSLVWKWASHVIHLYNYTSHRHPRFFEKTRKRICPSNTHRISAPTLVSFQDLSRSFEDCECCECCECFECFECFRQADPPGASSVTMTSADQMDSDRNEEKTCFDSKS